MSEASEPVLPTRLAEHISRGKCVLFLGAGVSLDSGAPSGASLADEIAREFLHLSDAGYDLSEAVALADAEDGRRRVNDWIAKRLRDLLPSEALGAIPRYRWHAIYTTNFDELVEKAYAAAPDALQRLHPIYSDRDPLSTLDLDEVPLYKLHGCVSRANAPEGHLVLTQDDFARVESSRQRLFNRLLDAVADLPVLYVGFARRDPDFARVLAAVEKAIGDLTDLSRSYAVQPDYVPAEFKRAETKKVTLLNMTAQEMFAALDDALPPERRVVAPEDEPASSRLTIRRGAVTARVLDPLYSDFEVLDDVLNDSEADPALFFKGSTPSWGDIAASVDARRDLQDDLMETLIVDKDFDRASSDIVLLDAEAGAGKTTLLRRLGSELTTTWDSVVLSLKPFGRLDFLAVEQLASVLDERLYLLIDDASRVANDLRSFIDAATRAKTRVTIVAATRTNEWREHPEAQMLPTAAEFELGPLSSGEIDRVLDALASHSALGYLEDVDRATQRDAFERRADKYLLVALREATEGKDFDEIVVNEYDQIPSETAKRAYLYVAALHRFGLLTRAAVLHRALNVPLVDLGSRVFAPATKIIVPQDIAADPEPYYRARHRLIAEIVFDRKIVAEADRLEYYVSLIRGLDLGYASDADTYRQLSRGLNRTLLRDFSYEGNKRMLMGEIQAVDPRDAYVYQHAAMMELALGDLRVAADHIKRAIDERPQDVAIRDTEGRIVLALAIQETQRPRKLARLAEAETIFVRNVRRRPSEPYGYRHLAETYWERARAETDPADQARFLAATDRVLEEGLDNANDTAMLLQYRAELEAKIGNRTEARELLSRALRERPDDVSLRRAAARLAKLDGDASGQIALLRDGVAFTPDAWELHYELATILAQTNDADASEVSQHFRAALLAPMRTYRPRLAYAAWLFARGEYDGAGEQFARLDSVELPARERLVPRTFPFGSLHNRQTGQVVRLAYTNGDVNYDMGSARVFFRRSEIEGSSASVRVGTWVSYELAFNLRGPLARKLRPLASSARPSR